MRTARILFRADVILCFERTVKIGIIAKPAVAVHIGGRNAPGQHLFGDHKPLLNDVAVYAGTHHPVEFVGEVVLADEKFGGQQLQMCIRDRSCTAYPNATRLDKSRWVVLLASPLSALMVCRDAPCGCALSTSISEKIRATLCTPP